MIMVAICDDEIEVGAELERTLIDIFDGLRLKYEIDVFFAGDELCREMEAGTHYDLIFLDIEFAKGKSNGVEVGQLIRNIYNNNIVSIVYISWEKRYSMKLFAIRPLDFLLKPLTYETIEQTVKTYLKLSGLSSEVLVYKKGHDVFKAQIKDIAYLENRERKIIIRFSNGKKEFFYGSLKGLYNEQLKNFDFLFIHASFLVNYDYVTAVKYDHLIVTGKAKPLPIAPKKRDEARKHYLEILKRRGSM